MLTYTLVLNLTQRSQQNSKIQDITIKLQKKNMLLFEIGTQQKKVGLTIFFKS